MDLADIRKKAKTDKEQGSEKRPPGPKRAAPRSKSSIQGVPEEACPDQPTSKDPLAFDLVEAAADPLEALFAGAGQISLATEESYLKGLEGPCETEELMREWLTFSLGKEDYALDIEGIHEIIKLREITDIPRVPDFILGIISLRGIIVPIFDLKKRLKLGSAEFSTSSRIIVCQLEERTVGLLVDRINQVVRISEDGIEPPPGILTGLDRDLVDGVGRHDGLMMILLNLKHVLDPKIT